MLQGKKFGQVSGEQGYVYNPYSTYIEGYTSPQYGGGGGGQQITVIKDPNDFSLEFVYDVNDMASPVKTAEQITVQDNIIRNNSNGEITDIVSTVWDKVKKFTNENQALTAAIVALTGYALIKKGK